MAKKKKIYTSDDVASLVIEGIREKKGKEIVTINFKDINNAIADYFIICHGTSTSQVEAIAENVPVFLKKKASIKPWHTEGLQNAEWVLIDYVDVVVHVFLDTSRQFYKLENLWADAIVERLKDED